MGVGEGWAGGGGTRSPLKRFCRMAVSSVPWSQKAMMIHVSSSSFSLPLDRCAVPVRTARPALRRAAPRPRARPPRPPRLHQATSALPACLRTRAQLAPLWPARRRPRRPVGCAGAAPPSLHSHVRRHTDALLSSLLCTSSRWGQGSKSRGASRVHRAVCAAPQNGQKARAPSAGLLWCWTALCWTACWSLHGAWQQPATGSAAPRARPSCPNASATWHRGLATHERRAGRARGRAPAFDPTPGLSGLSGERPPGSALASRLMLPSEGVPAWIVCTLYVCTCAARRVGLGQGVSEVSRNGSPRFVPTAVPRHLRYR
jgi:hypothetical protein